MTSGNESQNSSADKKQSDNEYKSVKRYEVPHISGEPFRSAWRVPYLNYITHVHFTTENTRYKPVFFSIALCIDRSDYRENSLFGRAFVPSRPGISDSIRVTAASNRIA